MQHQRYARAGFIRDLLPILPPQAPVQSGAAGDRLRSSPGKMPAIKRGGVWVPMKWKSYEVREPDPARWDAWGAGVGLRCRTVCAIDVDIDEPALASKIERRILGVLGPAPVRIGREPRAALPYHCPGLSKRKLHIRKSGAADCAVEVLGDGQQFVVEGMHPKTGRPYFWRDDRSLADVTLTGLTVVQPEQIDALLSSLHDELAQEGYEVKLEGTGRSTKGSGTGPPSYAPSFAILEAAVNAIPIEGWHYDTWFRVLCGIKGAARPIDQDRALVLAQDWSAGFDDCDEEVAAKWPGMKGTGWKTLLRLASELGQFDPAKCAPDYKPVPIDALFARYAWVETLKRVVELETGDLLDREQFDVRHNDITVNGRKAAWQTFVGEGSRLRRVKSVTYRPAGERIVNEKLPGLTGPCVNLWSGPCLQTAVSVADGEAATWLSTSNFSSTTSASAHCSSIGAHGSFNIREKSLTGR